MAELVSSGLRIETVNSLPRVFVGDVEVNGITSVQIEMERNGEVHIRIDAIATEEALYRPTDPPPTDYTWVLVPPDGS